MLPDRVQFETPENIQVSYRTAGLGTRFLAWLVDEIIIILLLGVILILLIIVGTVGSMFDAIGEDASGATFMFYIFGIMIAVLGFGSFLYFTLFELLMRGQTIGKHMASLRVVKTDGFGLDFGSIVIRNILRIVENLFFPPIWIVPLVSARSQRLGDMLAGTIVIVDKPSELSTVRDELARRPLAERRFQFGLGQLGRVSPEDMGIVEQLYERARAIEPAQAAPFVQIACQSLSNKLGVEVPMPEECMMFLEDFLTAEYHRQHRGLN